MGAPTYPAQPMIRSPTSTAAACLAAALLLGACQNTPEPRQSLSKAPNWTDNWQPVALPGKRATLYQTRLADGKWVLHAQSERSASMLRRSLRIEPDRLGTVTFSWKAGALVSDADVQHSDTEDAVLRVLLAFDGDPSRLSPRTRMMFDLAHGLSGEAPPFATLMYVWDTRAEPGELVIN